MNTLDLLRSKTHDYWWSNHGESIERQYSKDMAAKDARIAELEAMLKPPEVGDEPTGVS